MIYFDYAATSFVEDSLIEDYLKFLKKYYANPDSLHHLGAEVASYLAKAKDQIASLLGVKSNEIIFTSGASESNNLALKGIVLEYKERGNEIISTHLEHPSILNTLKQLEKYYNVKVKFLDVDENGKVSLEQLEKLITNDTILVTTTAVASETGHLINVEEIAKTLKKYPKVFYHVDATQAIGKMPLNLENIDLISFSGHKFFTLKGTGCLIKKEKVSLQPLICGGEQEFGLRAGTSNVAALVIMAKGLRLALQDLTASYNHVLSLHHYLWEKLATIEGLEFNSSYQGSPYIVNFSLRNYRNEVILNELSRREIYLSSRSACSSKTKDISSVVYHLYKDEKRAQSTLRVSLSKYNTKEEIDVFIRELKDILEKLKKVK